MVMHSPWWIQEHWGRGFEVISLVPDGFASLTEVGQGSVLLRKRDEAINPTMLERIAPGDERETHALMHNIDQLQRECASLRRDREYVESQLVSAGERNNLLEHQTLDLTRRLAVIESSRSWNMTKPLRAVAQSLRATRR
jgi:hypothetical protein